MTSDQSAPALQEVVRDFTRAREQLTALTAKLSEFEAIGAERKAEHAALEISAGAVSETASRLYGLAQSLDAAVGSVSQVLGAAHTALQATDAGQLMERLEVLDSSVGAAVASLQKDYGSLQSSTQELKTATEAQGARLAGLGTTAELVEVMQVLTATTERRFDALDAIIQRQQAELRQIAMNVNERIPARLNAAEAATTDFSASLQNALVELEKMARETAERERLQSENAGLRKQLDKVKSGLKPRQLDALGLS
jgi:chromosome segregation ATPase